MKRSLKRIGVGIIVAASLGSLASVVSARLSPDGTYERITLPDGTVYE